MKLRRLISVALLAAFAAAGLGAQANEKKARSVLDVTGITAQAQSISQVIIGMFEQQKGALSDAQQAKLYDILGSSFARTTFDTYILDAMLDTYDDAHCDALLKKYKDPLFIAVTKTEVDSNSPGLYAEIAAFDYATVDGERDAIIDGYLTNSSTLRFQEILTVSGIEAFVRMYNLFLPKAKKISGEATNAIIAQARRQINSPEQRMMLKKNLAVVYRSYDNAQLRTYFDFYKSPEAKWLSDVFTAGFSAGFESCMNDAAKRIVSEFHISNDNI